jgi:hypothetical protein
MPSAAAMRPYRGAGYRPDQDDNQTGYCDLFHRSLHPALAGLFKKLIRRNDAEHTVSASLPG